MPDSPIDPGPQTQWLQSEDLVPSFTASVDWCTPAVVLRVLILGNLSMLTVVLLSAPLRAPSWSELATVAVFVQPGMLVWIGMSCMLRRPLARASALAQYTALGVLAALSALLVGGAAQAIASVAISWEQALLFCLGAALTAVAITRELRLRQLAAVPRAHAAHLADLEQRMRPHFLFNSLNAISALIAIDARKAETAVDDLAELYRTLTRQPSGFCELRDELDIAKRYLAIESMRFGERLQVKWDIADKTLGLKVPTLCVQPLVENAVKHGVEASLAPVQLSVRSRIHAGRLEIEVINAHTPGATPSASKGTGTGLQNLSERLRLVYDIAADIRIKPEAHQFSVTLWLPI